MQIFPVELFTAHSGERIFACETACTLQLNAACAVVLSSPFCAREAAPFSRPFELKISQDRPRNLFTGTLRDKSPPSGSSVNTGKNRAFIHLRKPILAAIQDWRGRPHSRRSGRTRTHKHTAGIT